MIGFFFLIFGVWLMILLDFTRYRQKLPPKRNLATGITRTKPETKKGVEADRRRLHLAKRTD